MNELLEKNLICELKARYFRGLDTKDWALFADTLTDDVQGRYSDGQLSFDGKQPLVDFMQENLSVATVITMHHGHHPEITINEDGVSAAGVWYLQDMVIDLQGKTRLYGAAIYRDEYRKVDGQWLINFTGYSRTFEFVEPLSDQHVVLQTMFGDA
ncbi:MAG: nuclear transport factor 2 family protein [Gammaproteobacteria bacterium]|nr:nuclear transport factor 2 family protein [Gammaproteobacteria bacterium]